MTTADCLPLGARPTRLAAVFAFTGLGAFAIGPARGIIGTSACPISQGPSCLLVVIIAHRNVIAPAVLGFELTYKLFSTDRCIVKYASVLRIDGLFLGRIFPR